MKYYEMQTEYRRQGYFLNRRAGVWYISKEHHPLQILKRYSKEAVEDIHTNTTMLDNYISEVEVK